MQIFFLLLFANSEKLCVLKIARKKKKKWAKSWKKSFSLFLFLFALFIFFLNFKFIFQSSVCRLGMGEKNNIEIVRGEKRDRVHYCYSTDEL